MGIVAVAGSRGSRRSSPGSGGVYALPPAYVTAAEDAVGVQLERAGVRLAFVLNQVFDPTGTVPHLPTNAKPRPPTHKTKPPPAFLRRDRVHEPQAPDR